MREYGIVRRIWRVIYPALLYLLISGIIGGIVAAVNTISMMTEMLTSGEPLDILKLLETTMKYITDNALLISLLGYIAAVIVFIPVWIKTRKRYPRWNGGKFSVPVALCSAFAAIGLNVVLSAIIGVTGLVEKLPSYEVVMDVITGGSLPLQIIAVGLVAPVVEELCFRGITLSRMSGTKIWLAIAVQAVLFGLMHMNLLQSSYAALLGVFLGFITVRYRSVVYAVIAHIAFNLFSVLVSMVKSETVTIIIGIAVIVTTAASIAGLIKLKAPEPFYPADDTAAEINQQEDAVAKTTQPDAWL